MARWEEIFVEEKLHHPKGGKQEPQRLTDVSAAGSRGEGAFAFAASNRRKEASLQCC